MDRERQKIGASEVTGPPEADKIDRSFSLPLPHAVGISVLLLIVGLAAFGYFGEARATAVATSASIRMTIEYPSRFRYKQINPIRAFITNTGSQWVDTLTVSFDTAYVSRFSNVTMLPPAVRPWAVELAMVAPGETRRLEVGLQAEQYGVHRGRVNAYHAGSDTAAVELETTVFP